MKYACLVYPDEAALLRMPEDEYQAVMAECFRWLDELEGAGKHVLSSGLQSVRTACTLRQRNGKVVVTDGPFAETKEFLGGLTIFEARDLNEAIQIAARFPVTEFGAVEIRPCLDSTTETDDPLDRKIVESIRASRTP